MWTPGTWGEPMLAGGHFFPIPTTGVVSGCPEWPISGDTDRRNWNVVCSGKRGMVQVGGSAGTIGTKVQLTPAGELVDRGKVSRHGGCRWGVGSDTAGLRAHRLFRHCGAISRKLVDRITGSCRAGPKWCWEVGTRSLRSGWIGAHHRWSPRCPELGSMGGACGLPEGIVEPLSVEAKEFSLRTVPKIRITTGEGPDGSENYISSRERHGGIVKRSDAVVSTTAVAGAAALPDFAGASAPVDLAGTHVPSVAGMKFSTVAEVHSSAVDDEGDPFVVRTSRQRSTVVLDLMAAHRTDCGPMDSMSVPEPLEHSVVGVSLEGGDSSVYRVAVPNPIEHSGVSEPADLLSARPVPETLEHSVLEVPLGVGDGAVDRSSMPNPLEHLGLSEPADPPYASHPMIHSEVSGDGRNGQQDHV